MSKQTEGYSLGEVVRFHGKPFYIAWIDGEKIGLTYMTTTWGVLNRINKRQSPPEPSSVKPKPKPEQKPPSMKQAMQSWTMTDWRKAKE
jgi:hypothetical protein